MRDSNFRVQALKSHLLNVYYYVLAVGKAQLIVGGTTVTGFLLGHQLVPKS